MNHPGALSKNEDDLTDVGLIVLLEGKSGNVKGMSQKHQGS